jgi:sialidase-1
LSGRLDTKTDEFSVVELVNGSLMANLRHQYREKKYRMSSVSSDGGATWSALFEETELPDPICQGSLIRFTDARDGQRVNRLLFSNAASAKARENMTVRVSYDEGKTWPLSKVVNPGAAAYSSLTVLQDGTIGLLYEYRFKNVLPTAFQSHKVHTQIIFARFNLEWLTGGKDKFTSEATSSK